MKTKITILFTALAVLFLIQLFSHGAGTARIGGIGATSAPGETHCGSCHVRGIFEGELRITEFNQQAHTTGWYVPGGNHFFVVELSSLDNFAHGGIQFQALDTLGNITGFFLPGNTTNANTAPQVYLGGRQYIEQPRPILPNLVQGRRRIFIGAAWRPSPFYRGDVRIYASGVLADGDKTVMKDNAFVTVLELEPASPLEVHQDSIPQDVDGAQHPLFRVCWRDQFEMSYHGQHRDFHFYELVDISGKILLQGSRMFEPGEELRFTLPVAAGLYLFRSTGTNSPIYTTKLYKQ